MYIISKIGKSIEIPKPNTDHGCYLIVTVDKYLKLAKLQINEEINELLLRKAFESVKQKHIILHPNLLGVRFIPEIKEQGTPNERYRARFIIQAHKDKEKDLIITTSRKVRHCNIRHMSCIVAMVPSHNIWLQDVNQAYIKCYDRQRDVYLR